MALLEMLEAGLSAPVRGDTGAPMAAAAPALTAPVQGPAPVATSGFDAELEAFRQAIRDQESSGNYSILGPSTKYGRARGAYQILASNWDAWAAEAGIPGADWKDQAAQDRVARFKFTQYFRQFGSWDAVAVAWFAGPGRAATYARDPGSVLGLSDGGSTVRRYLDKMRDGMGRYLGGPAQINLATIPKGTLVQTQRGGREALINVFSSLMTGERPTDSAEPQQALTAPAEMQATPASYAQPSGTNGKLDTSQLVAVDEAGHLLAPEAASNWQAMVADAAADGVTISVGNSYRDYDSQVHLAEEKGLYSQGGLAATPGTSNHGWGTAVDINQTAAAVAWLQANAARYGFATISREPWHWEYRGGGSAAPVQQVATAAPAQAQTGGNALLSAFSRLMEVG